MSRVARTTNCDRARKSFSGAEKFIAAVRASYAQKHALVRRKCGVRCRRLGAGFESRELSSRLLTAKSIFGNESVPPRAGNPDADDFDRFAARLHVLAPCRRKPADKARNRVAINRQGASFYYPACALRPRR
jgi:hypothetical protein